ncbi:MAG: hypothetical protein IKU37_05295 [Candidatus Gastranaerophilales bacterium]|nr:hypothetical protein [Candidatus Gastranaerophilales bacterium]
MIQGIRITKLHAQKLSMSKHVAPINVAHNTITNFERNSIAASDAIKTHNFNLARTISFGASLGKAIENHTKPMITCGNEGVGEVIDITGLLFDTQNDRMNPGDSAKSNTMIGSRYVRNSATAIGATIFPGTQNTKFTMVVRGDDAKEYNQRSEHPVQKIAITTTPINKKGQGTKEQVRVLNTKGNKGDNFVVTIQDDNRNILMTNAGSITKKEQAEGLLSAEAEQAKNIFKPFNVTMDPIQPNVPMPSIGKGTEIVIGMENGRFVNEIKASIREFVEKIENEEIILPQFIAAENASDIQLVMLAGGFGSRAEYANAISEKIVDGTQNGAISTKGVFRTATGLTPMETTFVTLHKAGLLDCSKGKIGIGKNIHFYLNQGQNRGNGEFSADLYQTMARPGRKAALILPNDSMSRMTNAVIEANRLINSGDAAIAMIAKKVKAQDCIKTFGIIKYDPQTKQILGFAEKPSEEDLYGKYADYIDEDGMCVTNTFQFAVSDQAFQVLDKLEDLFIPKIDPKTGKTKETRDWSSQYVPIIKTLTEETNTEVIRQQLAISLNNKPEAISDEIIAECKTLLGNQKLYTIPTSEPWADCGTLNALYDTTMKIVSGDFPLEGFERARAFSCVNTQTGLIASSPEQKEEIESKYQIKGQVIAARLAPKITDTKVADIPVVVHRD